MTVQLSRFTVYRAPVFFVLYTPWWKLKRRPYPWCNILTTSIRVLWTPCQTATIISKLDSHWSSPRISLTQCSTPSVCVFFKVTVSCSSTYNSCPCCVISTQPVSGGQVSLGGWAPGKEKCILPLFDVFPVATGSENWTFGNDCPRFAWTGWN